MLSVHLDWNSFKQRQLPIRYIEANGNYYLYMNNETTEWTCILPAESAADFEENYKSQATNLA